MITTINTRQRASRKTASQSIRLAASDARPRPAATDTATRLTMIRDAAYFMAECRGFRPGHALDDWLAAERQIDLALAGTGESKWCATPVGLGASANGKE